MSDYDPLEIAKQHIGDVQRACRLARISAYEKVIDALTRHWKATSIVENKRLIEDLKQRVEAWIEMENA